MRQHIVPQSVPETSLRAYLTRAFPTWPAWLIRETLKKKDVRVNGAKSGAEAVVRAGDVLSIYVDDKYFEAPLQVIFEDDDWLVVDKPAGVAAHPSMGWDGPDVLGALKAMHVRVATSGAAEGNGRPQNNRIAYFIGCSYGRGHIVCDM